MGAAPSRFDLTGVRQGFRCVWALQLRLPLEARACALARFNLGIDSKLPPFEVCSQPGMLSRTCVMLR